MDDLKKKIVSLIYNDLILPGLSVRNPEIVVDQILKLMEQAGYVRLVKDQSLPEPIDHDAWCLFTPEDAYAEAIKRLRKAGFRKVEL